ncbi:hypothetical protein [Clostridium sp. ZS2-4]|uniref:hypothetical protein n=1 Tax=Clostridium sp. ZS2-4 TaxID=2987703 RepID=UPI00227C058B|nr:hypothetical protein [Clostridium sp. ZS2-4]MCY6355897.1 hypothetical protein [Clostridium sp. ZS2-4]
MGNLIKYELKGNYKLFLGLFIITILVNVLLYSRIGVWHPAAIYSLITLAVTVMFVMVLIFNIGSYSKEMHEDIGYLTFTLPVSGNKIIGAKTIVALIWFAAASILTGITFLLMAKGNVEWGIINVINDQVNLPLMLTFIIIGVIVSTLQLLIIIYFSITASRVAIRKKKIGKFLGFGLFIVLSTAVSYVQYLVVKFIPYSMNIDFTRGSQEVFDKSQIISYGNYAVIQGTAQGIEMNIAACIYIILVIIGLFIGTGYLIDNKIDM